MHAMTSAKKQDAAIADLQAQIDELQAELGKEEDAEKIVKRHIHLLHDYNEVKDAAQLLIGRLANLKETTVTQIHKDLELPEKD